jgi:5-methylcytosine-specific restriction protein B
VGALKHTSREGGHGVVANVTRTDADKNTILYGPPGTGKTYAAVQHAVAICDNRPLSEVRAADYADTFRRFRSLREAGRIAFTTFHQSYGYEDFVEGIRPVLAGGDDGEGAPDVAYELHDGVFKKLCERAALEGAEENPELGIRDAPDVWKVSLQSTGPNPTRDECLAHNHIRIGWDDYGASLDNETAYAAGGRAILNAFYNRMQVGDLVLSCYSERTIDAIGVVTGDAEWGGEDYSPYRRIRPVKWLVKGIDEDIVELNGGRKMTLPTVYRLSVTPADVIALLHKLKPGLFSSAPAAAPNHVLIIDEINRGNISRVFGELITLIEPSKRLGAPEAATAILPYSGRSFGVPDNVYVVGTMNTADRSIALIDTALRRRFSFVEMQPDPAVLAGISVTDIAIPRLLDTLNKRIAALLDREHTIGHSYFLPLRDDPSLERLADIFAKSVVPLLQEYFFDDYEKIRLVLGDNRKADDRACFIRRLNDSADLFGTAGPETGEYFEVNAAAFGERSAYDHLI